MSDELWSKVQARKAKTRAHYLRASDGRLLSKPEAGLIASHMLNGIGRCHLCGASLVVESGHGSGYYCVARRSARACTNRRGLLGVAADEAVYNKLMEWNEDPAVLDALLEAQHVAFLQAREGLPAPKRAKIEKEITKLEAEIGRFIGFIAAGTAQPDITAAITERRSKVESLKATLAEPKPITDPKAVAERVNMMVGPLVALGNRDPKAVRSTLRAIGVERLVFTPQADGSWIGEGFAQPDRLVVEKGNAGGPQAPRCSERPGKSRGAPLPRRASLVEIE